MSLMSSSSQPGRSLSPGIADDSATGAVRRIWQWLTLVQTDDPVRYVLNRGFAYVQIAVLGVAVLLTLILFTSGGHPAEIIVNVLALPIYVLALWLNRRGTIYGEVLFILMVVFATATGLDPADYAGPHPTVHVAFVFSVVCATLFIRPLAGLWAVLLQIGALGVALAFSHIPAEQVRLFLITGALHLGGIAAFLMVGATIFSRALRASIAANAELQRLNEGLELRVDERTADLAAANFALLAAKETAERARVAAEEANRYKSRFLANMSHELRTPLNAILNFADFLGDIEYGPTTEQQRMFQSRIVYNGEHLLGLINDILDLSKIEAGKVELLREPIDLHPLFYGVTSTAVGLTKEKGLALHLEADDNLPPVLIDKTRIRQVLLNLIANAAKFTEQGGITLRAYLDQRPTASGQPADANEAFVVIEVRDTGIGIEPVHQARIFEEFQQVQDEYNRAYQGTGLGLPISKRLVELHGGRMWLESARGAGSTFFFTLPVANPTGLADAAPTAIPDERSSWIGGDATTRGKQLITVIDGDPDSRQLLCHTLESAGYQVRSILDSQAALDELRRDPPALLILDLNIDPLDGWRLLGQLHQDSALAAVPVVACSIPDPSSGQISLLPNVAAYLAKPVRQEDLIDLARLIAPSGIVLVIDDDPDARQAVRQALEHLGHQVIEAAGGPIGLALVPEIHPSLIVLDLMMADMDGFTVLDQLRELPAAAHVPVVVTTPELDESQRVWLRERMRDCFQKPSSAPEFLDLVRELLTG